MNRIVKAVVVGVVGVVAVFAAMSVSGCATIIKGTSQNVGISSSPEGASVEIFNRRAENVVTAVTPATVRLRRKDGPYRVEVSAPGYETQAVEIRRSVGGWYIGGNFLLGGFIGWLIVDPITGAMWTLKPDTLHTNLQQAGMSFDNSERDSRIYVVLREQISEETFASLELVQIR